MPNQLPYPNLPFNFGPGQQRWNEGDLILEALKAKLQSPMLDLGPQTQFPPQSTLPPPPDPLRHVKGAMDFVNASVDPAREQAARNMVGGLGQMAGDTIKAPAQIPGMIADALATKPLGPAVPLPPAKERPGPVQGPAVPPSPGTPGWPAMWAGGPLLNYMASSPFVTGLTEEQRLAGQSALPFQDATNWLRANLSPEALASYDWGFGGEAQAGPTLDPGGQSFASILAEAQGQTVTQALGGTTPQAGGSTGVNQDVINALSGSRQTIDIPEVMGDYDPGPLQQEFDQIMAGFDDPVTDERERTYDDKAAPNWLIALRGAATGAAGMDPNNVGGVLAGAGAGALTATDKRKQEEQDRQDKLNLINDEVKRKKKMLEVSLQLTKSRHKLMHDRTTLMSENSRRDAQYKQAVLDQPKIKVTNKGTFISTLNQETEMFETEFYPSNSPQEQLAQARLTAFQQGQIEDRFDLTQRGNLPKRPIIVEDQPPYDVAMAIVTQNADTELRDMALSVAAKQLKEQEVFPGTPEFTKGLQPAAINWLISLMKDQTPEVVAGLQSSGNWDKLQAVHNKIQGR